MGGKNMTAEMARAGQLLNRGTMLCPVMGYLVSLGVSSEAAHNIAMEKTPPTGDGGR